VRRSGLWRGSDGRRRAQRTVNAKRAQTSATNVTIGMEEENEKNEEGMEKERRQKA